MNRRFFLLGLAATVAIPQFSFAVATRGADEEIPLWEGTPPGAGGPQGQRIYSSSGAVRHIANPSLSVMRPRIANGHGVLIAAGGGYRQIQIGKEALPAARWLVARGYTAYMLNYRLPAESWNDGNLVALQDAQRALRMIRQREKFVSALGFSAGAHLLGMAATRSAFQSYALRDETDEISARPDLMALIYPIITLEKPFIHTSTHKILVGPHAADALEAAWSVQNFVSRETPPCFLVQAEDDAVSDPQNSLLMYEACKIHHVPVELHRYPSGGHGFGMGRPGTPTMLWPSEFEKWLISTGY